MNGVELTVRGFIDWSDKSKPGDNQLLERGLNDLIKFYFDRIIEGANRDIWRLAKHVGEQKRSAPVEWLLENCITDDVLEIVKLAEGDLGTFPTQTSYRPVTHALLLQNDDAVGTPSLIDGMEGMSFDEGSNAFLVSERRRMFRSPPDLVYTTPAPIELSVLQVASENGSYKKVLKLGGQLSVGIATVIAAASGVFVIGEPRLAEAAEVDRRAHQLELEFFENRCHAKLGMDLHEDTFINALEKDLKIDAPGISTTERSIRVCNVQMMLLMHGYSPGSIDGIWGGNTEAAFQAFLTGSIGGNTEQYSITHPVVLQKLLHRKRIDRFGPPASSWRDVTGADKIHWLRD